MNVIDTEFMKLVRKNCIVVCVSIFSSVCMLLLLIFTADIGDSDSLWFDSIRMLFVNVDNVINGICALLLNAVYQKMYSKCCCFCEKIANWECCTCTRAN